MSNLKCQKLKKNLPPSAVVTFKKEPKEEYRILLEKVQNLTNEDKATLAAVLSPSVSEFIR